MTQEALLKFVKVNLTWGSQKALPEMCPLRCLIRLPQDPNITRPPPHPPWARQLKMSTWLQNAQTMLDILQNGYDPWSAVGMRGLTCLKQCNVWVGFMGHSHEYKDSGF